MATSIPVIDLSDPDRQSNAEKLARIFETVGFVYLDNVPGYGKEEEQKLLKVAKWLFSLPLEEKLRYSPKKWNENSKGIFRGYIPIDTKVGFLREQFGTAETLPKDDPDVLSGNPFYEPTPWPNENGSDLSFYETLTSHFKAMLNAAIEFLRLLSIGCGLPEDTFDSKFIPKSTSTLRPMHYPTYGETESPTFTCEEHIDTPFVTLLATFSYEGLEIQKEDNTWVSVAPRAGSLIVNIGDLLQRVSSGRFKATRHRVRDIKRDRFSVPFFFEPRFDAEFEFPLEKTSIQYGPWCIKRLRRHTHQFSHLPDFPVKN
jgi:isopenicillin N synthase-like dioxygenase